MGAFVLDVGHGYFSYQQLQAATDAAALAGAQQIYAGTAISTATAYSGTTGVSTAPNTYANLYSVSMVPGYPKVQCLTTVVNLGALCEGPNNANSIVVKEQAKIPTFFAHVFGINTMTLSVTSTAAIGQATPLNVALVVDTTLSEDTPDNSCGSSVTEIGCEMGGAQQLMAGLSPYVDKMSLFVFPNLQTNTVANDTNCNSAAKPQPRVQWPGQCVEPGDCESLHISRPFPPTRPRATPVASGNGTYQVVGFSSQYGGNYTASNSPLVGAVGTSNSGSNGPCLAPPNNDGMYGTYLPGVIYAAQAALAAEMASELATLPSSSPQPISIMIILGRR